MIELDNIRKRCFIYFLLVAFVSCNRSKNKSTSKNDPKELPKRPNILFAIADDAAPPYFGSYGDGSPWMKTPAIDSVASHGILYMNAFVPDNKCAPSRSEILTGRNPWQLGNAANHVSYFPKRFKTYVETLGEHGYFTGYTGKGWGPGFRGKSMVISVGWQASRTTKKAKPSHPGHVFD